MIRPLRRALLGAAVAALPLAAPAQDAVVCRGEIAVQGLGQVQAVPDVLRAAFSVEAEAASPADALADASGRTAALLAAFADAGIEERDTQTVQVSLFPVRERGDGVRAPRVVAWRAGSGVSVVLRDPAKFGAVAEAATDAGATGIGSLGFEVSDAEAKLELARAEAVKHALARAAEMAEAAGLDLGAVLEIVDGGAPAPQPRFAARAMASDMAESMPIAPGEQRLEARVSLRAELCG
ncbi:MAG: SIMPL domain-containing protein [Pseudomonadota bacterium]